MSAVIKYGFREYVQEIVHFALNTWINCVWLGNCVTEEVDGALDVNARQVQRGKLGVHSRVANVTLH